MVVFYDETRSRVGMLLEILTEKQGDLIKYLSDDTYSKVRVIVEENWMRLDFDGGDEIDIEEIRKYL
jgi:hypothetical protein